MHPGNRHAQPSSTPSHDRGDDLSEASTATLLAGVVTDARELARIHVDQMREEIKGEISALGDYLRARATVLAASIVGLILLGQAGALGLAAALVWPPWAGYAAIGVGVMIVAAVLRRASRVRSEDVDLIPERTMGQAVRDAQDVAEQASDAISGEDERASRASDAAPG
ncbi:MAG: phage holin family protein [Kofleriaceae bacterium]